MFTFKEKQNRIQGFGEMHIFYGRVNFQVVCIATGFISYQLMCYISKENASKTDFLIEQLGPEIFNVNYLYKIGTLLSLQNRNTVTFTK